MKLRGRGPHAPGPRDCFDFSVVIIRHTDFPLQGESVGTGTARTGWNEPFCTRPVVLMRSTCEIKTVSKTTPAASTVRSRIGSASIFVAGETERSGCCFRPSLATGNTALGRFTFGINEGIASGPVVDSVASRNVGGRQFSAEESNAEGLPRVGIFNRDKLHTRLGLAQLKSEEALHRR